MSSILYGTFVLAALASKVAALPMFYNDNKMGCEIPDQAYGGHAAPEESELIAVTVTKDGAAVTEYTPGEIYDVEVAAYEGSVNCWMHSSAGEVMPDNPETHAQANCPEASYSKAAAASHMFIWTAPDAAEPVTVSIAQAMGAGDNYKTNTVVLMAAGDALAPGAAVAPMAEEEVEGAAAEGATAPAPVNGGFAVATGALAAAAAAVAALAI